MWFRLDSFKLNAVKAPADVDRRLPAIVAEELSLPAAAVRDLRILARSVDARRGDPSLLYTLLVELAEPPRGRGRAVAVEAAEVARLTVADPLLTAKPPAWRHPVVVGTGPCGIFAALGLALAGCEPVILDRGFPAARREADYRRFLADRRLDPESNLLIGEGGAGTFSDGKLYTGTRDARAAFILQSFVDAGAPEEIVWLKRPHIGSDFLPRVAEGMRARLEELGATFRFGTGVRELRLENGRCRGVVTDAGERIDAPAVLVAAGLGGRALHAALRRQGVAFELKGFQLGCRIEHPQTMIDRRQYRCASRPVALGAAEYHLVSRPAGGVLPVSTFCMCPGGETVMASAWPEQLVANGMSVHARDGEFANSALIATLSPERFAAPEEAFGLLESLEREAFRLGGGDYAFPAQDAAAFLRGESVLRNRRGSAASGLRAARLDRLLPPEIRDALRAALLYFDRQCPGFIREGKLIGIESCVSSPVRFRRDPETLASSLPGLWLGGEGAGAAGGIMSAAADGLRLADAMMRYA